MWWHWALTEAGVRRLVVSQELFNIFLILCCCSDLPDLDITVCECVRACMRGALYSRRYHLTYGGFSSCPFFALLFLLLFVWRVLM